LLSGIAADASFYILFYNDIADVTSLHIISEKYDMYITNKLKLELINHIKHDLKFEQFVVDISDDIDIVEMLENYCETIKLFYPNIGSWKNGGEFEVIGLAYILKQYGLLSYVIIDDSAPHNFVKNNLSNINMHLIRSIGFLYASFKRDKLLKGEHVIEIYNNILSSIKKGKRPLNITEKEWVKIVKPYIIEIQCDLNG
jgi:hypothetical protein